MNRAQRRAAGVSKPPVQRTEDLVGIRCSGVEGEECPRGISIPFRSMNTIKSADSYIQDAGWTFVQIEETENGKLHVLVCDECSNKLFFGDEEESFGDEVDPIAENDGFNPKSPDDELDLSSEAGQQ